MESHITESVIKVENGGYFLVPCPIEGCFAKCGGRIVNHSQDPIWHQVNKYAKSYEDGVATRLKVTTKDEFDPIGDVIIIGIEPISD